MKNVCHGQVIGIPVGSSKTFAEEELQNFENVNSIRKTNPCGSSNSKDSDSNWVNKHSKKAASLAQGFIDHVTLGQNISEIVKGKLSLSKKILQAGSIERIFMKSFSIDKQEILLKAYQCYLSTTAGPIAGILFISTEKITFRSNKSLSLTPPKGEIVKALYKVAIPLGKIKCITPSKNVNKPRQKYLQIVTVDEFEFWFMGFINYQRSFKYLEQVISELQ
ncbi:hypothetical protein LUZ60_016595 [Juncus effusus]|nr:hypothetical protein LUZ60_016595 [Juncus effusus]